MPAQMDAAARPVPMGLEKSDEHLDGSVSWICTGVHQNAIVWVFSECCIWCGSVVARDVAGQVVARRRRTRSCVHEARLFLSSTLRGFSNALSKALVSEEVAERQGFAAVRSASEADRNVAAGDCGAFVPAPRCAGRIICPGDSACDRFSGQPGNAGEAGLVDRLGVHWVDRDPCPVHDAGGSNAGDTVVFNDHAARSAGGFSSCLAS